MNEMDLIENEYCLVFTPDEHHASSLIRKTSFDTTIGAETERKSWEDMERTEKKEGIVHIGPQVG